MKSENRVPKHYKKGTQDWKAQYDMLLDDGVVCEDCICKSVFGGNDKNTRCQWYPNRFISIERRT